MSNGINFVAPINQLGYGIAALNVVKAASDEGLPLALFVIGGSPQDVPEDDKYIVSEALNRAKMWDNGWPSVRMYHQFDLAMHCGSPRVGFPFFELDTFTQVEKHHLNQQDILLVASKWAKDVIKANGIYTPTFVVPLGVDRSIFYPDNKIKQDETTFFNVGKWEIRKGHDVIIEAFEQAFNKDDNVKLVMACNNPFLNAHEQAEWESRYKNSKLGSKVEIINQRFKTQKEVAKLMNMCDVGVFPARAEGWNLDMIEAMSCGKHIITTDNTAHSEFCTNENSSLVHVTDIEPAYDGKWFFEQGNWGKIGLTQIDQIAKNMRYYHEQKKSGLLGVNAGGLKTAETFSWRNTVKTMWSSIYG